MYQTLMDNANYPGESKRIRWRPIVGIASAEVNPTTLQASNWTVPFTSTKLPRVDELIAANSDKVVVAMSQANGQLQHAQIFTSTVHSSSQEIQYRANLKNEPTSPAIRAYIEDILYRRAPELWVGDLK